TSIPFSPCGIDLPWHASQLRCKSIPRITLVVSKRVLMRMSIFPKHSFQQFDGPSNGIVSATVERLESRWLLSAAHMDPTFGAGGVASSALFPGGAGSTVVLQPDGKLVVGRTAVSADGSLDFGGLARFNSNGSVDRSFGNNGRVVTPTPNGLSESVASIAFQSDGKILAALGGFSANGLMVIRYLPNGKIDTSFGVNGISASSFLNSGGESECIAVAANGKIVVAGWTESIDQYGNSGPTKFALERLNPDGRLDTTFGTRGKVITDAGGDAFGTQPDSIAIG